MNKTYTIIVHRKGEEDIIQTGYNRLNSIIIPAEMKRAFKKAFESGYMSIEVKEEEE